MSKKRLQMQKIRARGLPTTEKLARALETLNDPALAEMIRRARDGYYDDFKSPLATPSIELYLALKAAGHDAMAQRVVDGDFDARSDEANEWMYREGRKLVRDIVESTQQAKRINRYTCRDCGGVITTVDVDEGTTPMMLGCRVTDGCTGTMFSAGYCVDSNLEPDYEWYKPDKLPKEPGMRQHVQLGGLLLRKL